MNAQMIQSWQVALPLRVATLARVEPLHRFETTKASRSIDLSQHDLRTLSLMVFDAVIERMGLGSGASREEIIEALRPLILTAEPTADTNRIVEVSDVVLEFLINEADRRRAFRQEIRIVEDGSLVVREVSFHYLQQILGPNDEPLYRATVEGINLYTGTLGLDMEDAHAANAAVLKYQIGRGRFRAAVSTARQAVAISTGYSEQVRRALETVRRDITQVDWSRSILATLTEARHHLRSRVDADNEISAAVEEHQDDAEPHEREHIVELIEHIRECQARNADLHHTIMGANDVWLSEHARQAFRPRAISALPDLEAVVLRSALLLDDAHFDADCGWQVTSAFLPPHAPAIATDGLRLVDMLLAPLREIEQRDSDSFLPEVEEMRQLPERFTEQDFRDVDMLLDSIADQGALLSTMLASAREAGRSENVQTLLYLLTLQDYGETIDANRRKVDGAARSFMLGPFWGDDLHIYPTDAQEGEEG